MDTGLKINKDEFLESLFVYVESAGFHTGGDAVYMMRTKSKSRKINSDWINKSKLEKDYLNITIGNNNIYAWIANYGSGSYMDKGQKNKDYNSYISSGWFNKERLGRNHEVLSRQESYTMINYRTGTGTVQREGSRLRGSDGQSLSLERNGRQDGLKDDDGQYVSPIRYKAQRPQYFFDDSLEILEATFIDKFRRQFYFRPHSYIKGVDGK